MHISPVLRRNARAAWGSDGERWLDDLPRLLADVADRWHLQIGEPFDLSFNWVTAATRADGTPVVLKLGPATGGHLQQEAEALDAFGGRGAVLLLGRDDEHGALLLERALPGTRARGDDEAVVDAMRRLHGGPPWGPQAGRPAGPAPAPPSEPPPIGRLPELATLRAAFVAHLDRFPGDDPLPRRLVERANRLFLDLDASAERRVVLHGDLHHDNVLAATREPWLAIDPAGIIGDPGFDAGAMLYNPEPAVHDEMLLHRVPARVELIADRLGLPIERVRAWGFVMAVLSEVWTAEGGEPVGGRPLDVARLLEPTLRD
jgi:streptomycin 6-kinase